MYVDSVELKSYLPSLTLKLCQKKKSTVYDTETHHNTGFFLTLSTIKSVIQKNTSSSMASACTVV